MVVCKSGRLRSSSSDVASAASVVHEGRLMSTSEGEVLCVVCFVWLDRGVIGLCCGVVVVAAGKRADGDPKCSEYCGL